MSVQRNIEALSEICIISTTQRCHIVKSAAVYNSAAHRFTEVIKFLSPLLGLLLKFFSEIICVDVYSYYVLR